MTIKRLLQVIAVAGIAVALGAFFYWTELLSSSQGEDFGSRHAKIDLIWTIIPASLIASVVAGIASSMLQPRSKKSSRTGLMLALAAALLAAGILWILLNLGIS